MPADSARAKRAVPSTLDRAGRPAGRVRPWKERKEGGEGVGFCGRGRVGVGVGVGDIEGLSMVDMEVEVEVEEEVGRQQAENDDDDDDGGGDVMLMNRSLIRWSSAEEVGGRGVSEEIRVSDKCHAKNALLYTTAESKMCESKCMRTRYTHVCMQSVCAKKSRHRVLMTMTMTNGWVWKHRACVIGCCLFL